MVEGWQTVTRMVFSLFTGPKSLYSLPSTLYYKDNLQNKEILGERKVFLFKSTLFYTSWGAGSEFVSSFPNSTDCRSELGAPRSLRIASTTSAA